MCPVVVSGTEKNAYVEQCLTHLSLSLLGDSLHVDRSSLEMRAATPTGALQRVPDISNYMHRELGYVLFSDISATPPLPPFLGSPSPLSSDHSPTPSPSSCHRTEDQLLIKPANHKERGREGGGGGGGERSGQSRCAE